MSAITCTSSPVFVNVTVPVTWLPDFDSSFAVALVTSCPCATRVSAHNMPREIIIVFMAVNVPPGAANVKRGTGILPVGPVGVSPAVSEPRNRQDACATSVDQPLIDSGVGVDAAVAQEWPVGSRFVHPVPFDLGHDGLFAVHARLRDDFAAGRHYKTLAPELDPVAAGGSFVTDAIHRGDVTTVRDRVTALHRFPRGILRRPVFFFLARVPADRGGIK